MRLVRPRATLRRARNLLYREYWHGNRIRPDGGANGFRDAVERRKHAALQEREVALDRVGMMEAGGLDVFLGRMVACRGRRTRRRSSGTARLRLSSCRTCARHA
jgi:hypothetical protein